MRQPTRLSRMLRAAGSIPLLALAVAPACRSVPPPPPSPPPVAAAPTAPLEENEPATLFTVRVTASRLNVRRGPSTGTAVVAKVKRGTTLGVVAEQPGWVEVHLADGGNGWLAARYVDRQEPCEPDRALPEVLDAPPLSFSEDGPHGTVVIEAHVGADGTVVSTRVAENSTGSAELEERAEAELARMKFLAPVRHCRRVPFIYEYRRSY
jgi:TonB family protein